MSGSTPYRQVRADFDQDTITVYQAYPPPIAEAALRAGTFAEPFKRERMTWIKPSFLWLAYRCGWAAKPGQERVLAIRISRAGFHWALAHSCLSHYDRDLHPDRPAQSRALRASPARVQWDPERGLHHEALDHRSIQIGLSGAGVDRYLDEWITAVADITEQTQRIGALVAARDLDQARALLPPESPYPLPPEIAARVQAD